MKSSMLGTVVLSCAAGCLLGWTLRTPSSVHAAGESVPMQFQLQGTGPSTQLGVYYPNDKDLYVYPGIAAGSSSVNCAFRLHMGKPGGAIERSNCGVGKLE